MTQPAGGKKKKSFECRARAAARGDTASTWHFTSEEPRGSSPDFPPYTHTERRGERERRTAPRTTTKKKKSLWKEEKQKHGGGSSAEKDEAETNQPFSPASPRTNRLHPGPWTISGRICPARTYPTLSCLGKAAATDGGVSVGCAGVTKDF